MITSFLTTIAQSLRTLNPSDVRKLAEREVNIGLTAATVLLALTPWRLQPVRAISLVLFLVGAIFTIYLRYVEQAHFDGNVCIWCVSFMAAWWVAGACELLRLVRPPAPAPEPA